MEKILIGLILLISAPTFAGIEVLSENLTLSTVTINQNSIDNCINTIEVEIDQFGTSYNCVIAELPDNKAIKKIIDGSDFANKDFFEDNCMVMNLTQVGESKIKIDLASLNNEFRFNLNKKSN